MSDINQLRTIREEILHCQKCPLAKGRKNAVPGEGPASVDVMFIGEGPGYHENQQGKPFVGQAGMFLDELLASADLKREEVFITNVVKCRPPDNRDPMPEELAACAHYLDEQIALLDPKVIVTLGRFSMAKFIENGKITQIHGKSHQVGKRLIVTMYHPAAALHQPALRPALIEDFSKLRHLLGKESSVVQPKVEALVQPKWEASVPETKSVKKEEKTNLPEQLSLF
ncbi:MAG TPA: uracil-DNA glycosylase [Anaerolineaceae bacterium]|jgi:DNA polymerase|nr:uracil-DNA glycosylase [Anaerolineaceae bacterium]HQJ32953.1 uracil-DNA glycosylase [Anaerolineaceae bacterium]